MPSEGNQKIITLTIWGYKAIHPNIKPFCIELGEPHGDIEVTEYKGKNKFSYKNLKCLKCGRLLLKNGELVKQRSVPDWVRTEFDMHGYAYLDKDHGNTKMITRGSR